jgi:hypothetical protein
MIYRFSVSSVLVQKEYWSGYSGTLTKTRDKRQFAQMDPQPYDSLYDNRALRTHRSTSA